MHDSVLHGDIDTDGNLIEDYGWYEMCPRCMNRLLWIQSSWQCSKCKFKEGCCG